MQAHSEQQLGEELAKAAEERDALQDKLTQLQDKVDPHTTHTTLHFMKYYSRKKCKVKN